MTINTDIENLRFPVGKFSWPNSSSHEDFKGWIKTLHEFPFEIFNLTSDLNTKQLSWAYRPDGWSIRQLVHHCADSHMNSFIRYKWALTEDSPKIKAYFEDRWANLPESLVGDVKAPLSMIDGLHERWVTLINSLSEKELEKVFVHPETGKETRLWDNTALYAWHCNHHMAHIRLALEFEGQYKQNKQ